MGQAVQRHHAQEAPLITTGMVYQRAGAATLRPFALIPGNAGRDRILFRDRILERTARVTTAYEMIGGEAGVRALVTRFYELMDSLPEAAACRAIHPEDLSGSAEKLFEYLTGWLGGPPIFVDWRNLGPPHKGAGLSMLLEGVRHADVL